MDPSPVHGIKGVIPKRWDDPSWDPYLDVVPLHPKVMQVADLTGLDPRDIDWHVEAIHGWEPHDEGYAERVIEATKCVANGGTCG